MNPNNPQATAASLRNTRFRPRLSVFPAYLGLLLAGLCGGAHALYLNDYVTAYRVPDGKIKVDGSPDLLWKAIVGRTQRPAAISFGDYAKMVLLQPEKVRNDDPSLYVNPAPTGSVTLLAAYDNTALYFLFLVKTKSVVNPKTLCSADNLWKADAPEVYLDPTTWVNDTASYRSFFSTDAGGLVFGTSPKTVQLDKPLNDKDERFFFRNRATADKFQIPPAKPSGLSAVSLRHSSADTGTVIVEMKIPYWGGLTAPVSANKSMFISWGFNLYPDSLWSSCNGNPIAYRWAKHYLNYDNAAIQPPGWRINDSTHYDPTRSWDGWGRFELNAIAGTVDTSRCQTLDPTIWDLAYWGERCRDLPATTLRAASETKPISGRTGWRLGSGVRDALGRILENRSRLFSAPWNASEAGPGEPDAKGNEPL